MTPATQNKSVGVIGQPRDGRYRRLLDALSQLYPVEFHDLTTPDAKSSDALVVLNGSIPEGLAAAARGMRVFVVTTGAPGKAGTANPEVRFGTSTHLEECLRGQSLSDRQTGALPDLPMEPGDEVLASREGRPVWLNRSAGPGSCQLVGTLAPLTRNEFLFQHLNGGHFLGLLPLANFLRQLVKDIDWQSPPSRACLVIDDPSLYWPSYGFINYRQLADHARQHGYCVAIATIPLDSWWVNNAVANTFRSGSPQLSLLIHGNNHTSRELLADQNGATGLEVAAQALRRMERIRQKHGIDVLKIMVAPHGAIANGLLPHLLSLGYEAALVTTELLVQHNPQGGWPVTVGLRKSQVLGGGLPIIPRIRMSADWNGDALLAAFHRQPVVIAGHHYDARDGLQVMEDIGRTIGNIKGVAWSDMRGILRSNYLFRAVGDVLLVRLFSRNVSIPVPPGVRSLLVERPWLENGRKERLLLRTTRGTTEACECGLLSEPLALGEAKEIEVSSRLGSLLDSATVPPPPTNLWPFARKFFMEVRDRCAPTLFSLGWHGDWPDTHSL